MSDTDGYVIVVGNEKGGAGKSTVAMHLSVALMRMGKNVGVIAAHLATIRSANEALATHHAARAVALRSS